jgi:hypothetical protein
VLIAPRAGTVESHVAATKDGFDQKGRAGKTLAEAAMTNCDTHGLGARLIAHVTAQTATFVQNGHGRPLYLTLGRIAERG